MLTNCDNYDIISNVKLNKMEVCVIGNIEKEEEKSKLLKEFKEVLEERRRKSIDDYMRLSNTILGHNKALVEVWKKQEMLIEEGTRRR